MTSPLLPRWLLAGFLGVGAVLVLTVWQSSEHLSHAEAGLLSRIELPVADGVLGPWLVWDATAYDDIAEHGYTEADRDVFEAHGEARVAYFPGYPRLAGAVGSLIGDTPAAMVLITITCGLAYLLCFHRWMVGHCGEDAARWGTVGVLLFPWAFFLFATGYSDALYLVAAVGAFLLMERDRPLAAGLAGALASATRAAGVAVVIGLAIGVAQQRGALRAGLGRPWVDWRRIRRRDLWVLTAALGFLGYCAFCWRAYGDPLAFSTAQRGWGQAPGPHTWFKVRFVDFLLDPPSNGFVARLVIQAVVALAFCAAIPAVWRRFGPAYGSYTAVALLLPLIGSAAFASQGRYVLAAFPVFALMGERLASMERARSVTWLALSGVALIGMASLWGRGFLVG